MRRISITDTQKLLCPAVALEENYYLPEHKNKNMATLVLYKRTKIRKHFLSFYSYQKTLLKVSELMSFDISMERIRLMNEKDLSKVCELYKEANPFATKEEILSWTKETLKKTPKYHLVYEINGRIIGAISGKLSSKKTGVIDDIAVEKKHRRKGIGKKLLDSVVSRMKKNGVKKALLWVDVLEAVAILFYHEDGFKLERIRKAKN